MPDIRHEKQEYRILLCLAIYKLWVAGWILWTHCVFLTIICRNGWLSFAQEFPLNCLASSTLLLINQCTWLWNGIAFHNIRYTWHFDIVHRTCNRRSTAYPVCLTKCSCEQTLPTRKLLYFISLLFHWLHSAYNYKKSWNYLFHESWFTSLVSVTNYWISLKLLQLRLHVYSPSVLELRGVLGSPRPLSYRVGPSKCWS